ncbi:YtpI family protein [Bacillus sp. FSL W7-1360]
MARLLIIFVIGSCLFYVIGRVRSLCMTDSLQKRIVEVRARLALGAALLFLGINFLFFASYGKTELFVGAVFLLIGSIHTIYHFKAHKHYMKQLD